MFHFFNLNKAFRRRQFFFLNKSVFQIPKKNCRRRKSLFKFKNKSNKKKKHRFPPICSISFFSCSSILFDLGKEWNPRKYIGYPVRWDVSPENIYYKVSCYKSSEYIEDDASWNVSQEYKQDRVSCKVSSKIHTVSYIMEYIHELQTAGIRTYQGTMERISEIHTRSQTMKHFPEYIHQTPRHPSQFCPSKWLKLRTHTYFCSQNELNKLPISSISQPLVCNRTNQINTRFLY